MNSKKISLAKKIAFEMHEGQTDKAGRPYTEHLSFVADHVDSENEKCVAYLHDILEDTDFSHIELRNLFGEEIFNAVLCMTHHSGEPYFDYVKRAGSNPISRKVKMADLTHNMDLSRLESTTDKDMKRVEKYKTAYKILLEMN